MGSISKAVNKFLQRLRDLLIKFNVLDLIWILIQTNIKKKKIGQLEKCETNRRFDDVKGLPLM